MGRDKRPKRDDDEPVEPGKLDQGCWLLIIFLIILLNGQSFCCPTGSGNLDDDESVEGGGGETTKEEKNAFAMRVLRRIRTKLEGREPGTNYSQSTILI